MSVQPAGVPGGPVIEVGVVDVLVFRPAQRGWLVLALERAKDTRCPGSWEMVHGHREGGESLEVAAVRETQEETGLVPARLLSVTMHPFYVLATQTVQLAAVFAAVVSPEAKVVLSAEHARHAWLTPSQARRRFSWPHDRRALDDARILLGMSSVQDALEVRG